MIPPIQMSSNLNVDLSLNHNEKCFIRQVPCNGTAACVPYWSEWMDWSECSPECSIGNSERTRYCHVDSLEGPTAVDPISCKDLYGGNAYETKVCNEDTCSGWGAWNLVEECSAACEGEGIEIVSRECFLPGPFVTSLPESCFVAQSECTGQSCYAWGEWGKWSDCSAYCSPGETIRFRECFDSLENIVDLSLCPEGDSIEYSPCNVDMCEEWGEWEASECPTACFELGEKTVFRKCTHAVELSSHPRQCHEVNEPCIKECNYIWTDWSDWSICEDSCSQGLINRTRTCTREDGVMVDPSVCGYDTAVQQEPCNVGKCVAWDEWKLGTCTGSCEIGIGIRTDFRQCMSENVQPDQSCMQRTIPCAINCIAEWDEWGDWSECPSECSPGIQTRKRNCLVGGNIANIKFCQGISENDADVETIECNVGFCSDYSAFDEIDVCWAGCNQTYTEEVYRTCNHNITDEIKDKTSKCFFKPAKCVGDCRPKWSYWAGWSLCDEMCGAGTKQRQRICLSEGKIANASVCSAALGEAETVETTSCNRHMCSQWSGWIGSKCSAPCYGKQNFTRICIGKGDLSRNDYSGDTSCFLKQEPCGPEICPFQYSEWSVWSNCSNECSPGRQNRKRVCMNLKNVTIALTKCEFLGLGDETQDCNMRYCKKWETWRPQRCSLNCGGEGWMSRTRICDPSEMSEKEKIKQHPRTCYKIRSKCTAPPCDGEWTNWHSWTQCSQSCGQGVRSKVRNCLLIGTSEVVDGKKCSGANNLSHNKEQCNKHLCTSWSMWKDTSCTKKCGKKTGEYQRLRNCRGAVDKSSKGLSLARGGELCYKRTLSCAPKACALAP